jgi:hypothetical protein
MFTGVIESKSHEGGFLVSFTGSSPAVTAFGAAPSDAAEAAISALWALKGMLDDVVAPLECGASNRPWPSRQTLDN